MLNVTVSTNLPDLIRQLEGFSQRRINSVIASALTATANEAQKEFRTQVPKVFDRPKPYTTNSTFVMRATAQSLSARVGFKAEGSQGKGPGKYLIPEIFGGKRVVKAFERKLQAAGLMPQGWVATPGPSARLDGYGNMSGSTIKSIINGTTKLEEARSKRAKQYFAVKPGDQTHLSPGVYERKGRSILKVLNYVTHATYRKQLDIGKLVERVRDREFPRLFQHYAEQSIARKLAQR